MFDDGFNDRSSLLAYFATRRSGSARNLAEPGPNPAELAAIAALAARTPDHGKLAPWRLVHIRRDQRQRLAEVIVAAYRAERPEASKVEIDAMIGFAMQSPCLLAVIAAPVAASKIPRWEQHLSAGALCMNLLHAIHAHGFAGSWLTGWAAYSADVLAALGGGPDDQIAGFVFAGTPVKPLEERPRPAMDVVLRDWADRG